LIKKNEHVAKKTKREIVTSENRVNCNEAVEENS
jgi:hypothetical protein